LTCGVRLVLTRRCTIAGKAWVRKRTVLAQLLETGT
jgi:hypothetical protein